MSIELCIIKGRKYYNVNDLIISYSIIFRGCRNSREFINREKISLDNYLYARKNSNGSWSLAKGNNVRYDKVMIKKDYFDEKYLDKRGNNSSMKFEIAPPIIKLEDNEKFFNNDGKKIEIEVRGEREHNGCFFKVKDIMEGFDMPSLKKNILDDRRGGYQINKHYVYFNLQKIGTADTKQLKQELFITYIGMLRMLFTSKKSSADKFVDWATETLFVTHMGTPTQKLKLISNIFGVPCESVKEVFNKTSDTIPCNYLFSLGTVANLRNKLKISDKYHDDDMVAKFGTTNDLKRRMGENELEYEKFDVNMELVIYNYIDPQYIFQSETRIKNMFQSMNMNVKHDKYREIVVIPKKDMKTIKEGYQQIAALYMGHIKELIHIISEKDSEIVLLKKDNEVQTLKKSLEVSEIKHFFKDKLSKKKMHIISLKKDLEMANYKHSDKKPDKISKKTTKHS